MGKCHRQKITHFLQSLIFLLRLINGHQTLVIRSDSRISILVQVLAHLLVETEQLNFKDLIVGKVAKNKKAESYHLYPRGFPVEGFQSDGDARYPDGVHESGKYATDGLDHGHVAPVEDEHGNDDNYDPEKES
jgi:hypothetical protein